MDNMEFYWEIAARIIGIMLLGMNGICFSCFANPFLGKNKPAWVIGITYCFVMFPLYMIPWNMGGMVPYMCGTLTVFGTMCLLEPMNVCQKIFLTVIMYLTQRVSHGIALIPRRILFDCVINTPFMYTKPILQFGVYVAVDLAYVCWSFLLLKFLFHILSKAYIYKRENMTKKELGLMLVTPLSVLAGDIAFTFYSRVYESDMNQYIWNIHSAYLWIENFYELISFAAMVATIMFYQSIKDGHRREKESVLLAEQIEHTKLHIRGIERMYRDIRGIRHDMGNHITILENLFLKNEPKETEKYLQRWKEQLNEITPEFKTGNPITDVILMEKHKEVMEKGIDFRCDFHYPQRMKIDAFDVSVILNNALTNAIEGAEKSENPYISISSYRNKNAYMIEIKNSFNKQLEFDEENGLPETTKTDRENHGYGMANIRKVARKYFGDIDIMVKDEEFQLSIMLMME